MTSPLTSNSRWIPMAALVAVVLALVQWSPPSPASEADAWTAEVERCVEALQQGRWADAEVAAHEVVRRATDGEDELGRARGLLLLAMAELQRGELVAARGDLRRAATIFAAGGDPMGAWAAWFFEAGTHLQAGDDEGAIRGFETAAGQLERWRHGGWYPLDTLKLIGPIIGDLIEDDLEEVENLPLGLRARIAEGFHAKTLLFVVELELRRGNLEAARAAFRLADEVSGPARYQLADQLERLKKLLGLDDGRQAGERSGSTAEGETLRAAAGRVHLDRAALEELKLGADQLAMGQRSSAERHFRRCMERSSLAQSPVPGAYAEVGLALLSLLEFDLQKADDLLERALAVARVVPDPGLELLALSMLATVDLMEARLDQADKRLAQALALAERMEVLSYQGWLHQLRTSLFLLAGRRELAIEHLDRSLAIFDALGDPRGMVSGCTLVGLQKSLASTTREGALSEAQRLLEEVRADFLSPVSSASFSSAWPALNTELQIQLQSDQGDAAGAFDASERGRARTLLERMSSHVSSAVGETTLAEVRKGYCRLLFASEPRPSAGYSVDVPKTVTVEELRRDLDEDTVLVAYFTGKKTYGWVISREGVRLIRLRPGKATLQGKVTAWHRALASRRANAEGGRLAAELHDLLIAPLELPKDARRLVVIPHGPLYGLPFAALKATATGELLAARWILTQVPSASAIPQLARPVTGAEASAFVLGDAGEDLPAAATAARAVAALHSVEPLLGAKALESSFWQLATESRIVHLAVHGDFDENAPLESHLRLVGDAAHDGRLEASEVFAADFSQTSLVVLAACETGRGTADAGGESLGLTHAFLAAGSRTVLSTLWQVDDASAAALTTAFHRRLAAGADAALALQQAQAELRADPRWSDPFHWAAFVLTGGVVSGVALD